MSPVKNVVLPESSCSSFACWAHHDFGCTVKACRTGSRNWQGLAVLLDVWEVHT